MSLFKSFDTAILDAYQEQWDVSQEATLGGGLDVLEPSRVLPSVSRIYVMEESTGNH